MAKAKSVCGTIIVTNDVDRLANFYGNVLGMPLVKEEHAGLPVHYGIDIGQTHLGLHPPQSFDRDTWPAGGSVIALEVDSLDAWIALCKSHSLVPTPVRDEGFGRFCRINDPDGNTIELVELAYEFGTPAGEEKARTF
jgi:catechol 2,3-dioxygenase-like lactoylglutathione lyase family enzyme